MENCDPVNINQGIVVSCLQKSENHCLSQRKHTSLTPQKSILKSANRDLSNLPQECVKSPKSVTFTSAPLVTSKPEVDQVTPTCYEQIRELDEKENWTERATIVTKTDHQVYTETAQQIIGEVVDSLPINDQGVTLPKIEAHNSGERNQEAEKTEGEPAQVTGASASVDPNVTSDEDFNTPPTTPSKELLQQAEEVEERETGNQESAVPAVNNTYKARLQAEVNPNDTVDDLADIIGGLSIETSKPSVNTVEINQVDIEEATPETSNDIPEVKVTETLNELNTVELPEHTIEFPVHDSIVEDIPCNDTKEFLVPEDQDITLKEEVSKSDTFDSGVVEDLDILASVGNQKLDILSEVTAADTSNSSLPVEKVPLVDVKVDEVPVEQADIGENVSSEDILQPSKVDVNVIDDSKEIIPNIEGAGTNGTNSELLLEIDVQGDNADKGTLISVDGVAPLTLEKDNSDKEIRTDTSAEQASDQLDSKGIEDLTVENNSQAAKEPTTETVELTVEEISKLGEAKDSKLVEDKVKVESKEQPCTDGQTPEESVQVDTEDQLKPDVKNTDEKALIDVNELVDDSIAVTEVGLDREAPEKVIQEPEEKPSMEESQEAPESPILPKGSYNIDWDNFDDSVNPFETKSKVVSDFDSPSVSSNKPAASVVKDNKKTAVSKASVGPKKTSGAKKPAKVNPSVRTTSLKKEEVVDPFKPKKAISNSPTPATQLVDDDIDPFKPKKAISNSPPPVAQPFDDDIDPFKSKKAISNSPPPVAVGNDVDPFKSTQALVNSPIRESLPPLDVPEDSDPFKPRKALSNSPTTSVNAIDEEVDPFKPKKTLTNSPTFSHKEFPEDIDPFKASKTLANSPPGSPKIEDVDPFKAKTTLANSPPPESKSSSGVVEVDQNCVETNNNTSKIESPMKKEAPKKKTGVSAKKNVPKKFKPPPKQVQQEESEEIQIFMPGQKPPPGPSKEETSTEPEPSKPVTGEMSESQASNPCSQDSGVDTRSPPPADETTDLMNETEPQGIMEEEFRQASEVFSDPSAWDMLEKFGSGNLNDKESTLSRQSLYVKFDPLVKGDSPAAQKVRSHLLHSKLTGINLGQESDDLLLMSTPPAKDRSQHPAVRALADKVSEGNSKSGLEASNGDVDRILQCSPYSSPNGETHSSSSSSVSGLPTLPPDDMCESREQPYIPELTQSWFETVKSLGELDGDSAILSTDSLDCVVDWVPKESGRPESPLKFDHEEIMRIDTSLNNNNKANGATSGGNASKKDTSTPPRPSEPLSDPDIIEVLKYSQGDVNRMRREWELEKRGTSLIKERDYVEQMHKLEAEKSDLEEQNKNLKATADDMKDIVAQFEKTMTQLIAEKESSSSASKDSITDLIRERDQAYEDIQSVEAAFGDLHRRYEKTKQTLEGYKKNEDTLKKCVADYQSKLKKQDERYQALKAHAEEKLEQANDEIEKVRKSTETEIARLTVALKRAELKTSSLEADLERKSKEIVELTAICDELISKVGH